MGELTPYFLAYATHEWGFSARSVLSYSYDLRSVIRVLGDVPPSQLRSEHILLVKAEAAARGVGPARVRRLVNGLKSFLRFCRLAMGLETLDPKSIRGPRVPRRDVTYLTPDEVRQFISAIPMYKKGSRAYSLKWLTFRALVEVLLGTGMRIAEALSLERSSINFATGEARIIGKGNKGRVVFFNPRALAWVKEYMNRRSDTREHLFALPDGRPLGQRVVSKRFKEIRSRSGLQKKVSPHILRHTVATTLLFNGCPVGHIKEILGHALLETTCKFYLGVDKRAAKDAHLRYLNFDS